MQRTVRQQHCAELMHLRRSIRALAATLSRKPQDWQSERSVTLTRDVRELLHVVEQSLARDYDRIYKTHIAMYPFPWDTRDRSHNGS